jgi:hypothetical protein
MLSLHVTQQQQRYEYVVVAQARDKEQGGIYLKVMKQNTNREGSPTDKLKDEN